MRILVIGLLICLGASAWSDSGDALVVPSVRVKFVPPVGWHAIVEGGVEQSLERLRPSNPAIDQLLQKRQRIPKLTFTKHPGDFPSLNPTLQVYVVTDNRTPGQIVQATVNEVRSMPGFKMLEEPRAVNVAGRKAAILRCAFELSGPDGTPLQVESWMIAVVDGNQAAVFGMSGQSRGPDRVETEFQRLVASLAKIEPGESVDKKK